MRNKRNCPICGNENADFVFKRIFKILEKIAPFNSYDVRVCTDCGFIYSTPNGTFDLDGYYENMSKYEIGNDQNISKYTEQKRFGIISKLFFENVDLSSKILDIGCGSGGLLYNLKKIGFLNLKGMDPSEKCQIFAKEKFDIDVLKGIIGKNISEKYDVIILEEVLEHVLDINLAIEYCKKLLKKEGVLYIGVPNIRSFENREDLFQEFSIEHINYFSTISIKNLLIKHGFKNISTYEYDEVRAIFTFWKKEKSNNKMEKDNLGIKFINNYLNVNNKLLRRVNSIIDDIKEEVLVWGTGTHTATLYEMTNFKNLNILAFIDSNKKYQGKLLFGKKIISPSEIDQYKNVPILISSQISQNVIKNNIIRYFDNDIICLY